MHIPEPVSGTVLLIDRNERLPKQRGIFEKAGFTVLAASSTEEGLKMARAQHPDLVVSEVMLEKPDAGFVLGYKMKADKELADIPLILLSSVFQTTGTIFDLNSPQARQWIKADVYMERPVTPDHLLASACSLLHCPHAM
jgi:DNA-binding response OmpR family regulator